MEQLTTKEQVDEVVGRDTAVLFKHSAYCPISAMARQAVDGFLGENPGAPVFLLDVNENADVSRYVAERMEVEHQSPQVILVRGGRPAWHASRFEITPEALDEQLGSKGGGNG